ncbi:cytochrome c oxidase assembly factor 7 [Arctopsyche grandis]|uniref:cytochrome c oxidase assembly factor 7 n=1 Tax=Arctopsyche grandis TaxID=121162 RepID=UPI00406D895A
MNFNFKNEEDVKQYLDNLNTEYQFGCYREKKPEVCHLLGDYIDAIGKDFTKAGVVYKENCDVRNFPLSCRKYGGYLSVGKGLDKADLPESYKYFEKACELKDASSCFNQGILLTASDAIAKDPLKAAECFKKGCEYNNDLACYHLSSMYLAGVRKPPSPDAKPLPHGHPPVGEYLLERNMKEAFTLAKKACELNNIYACANVSQMYTRGDGVEKNEELAKEFKNLTLRMQSEIEKKGVDFQQGIS